MHTLSIIDRTGDTRHTWDVAVAEEVESARQAFGKALEAGYMAVALDEQGQNGTLITDFDPNAKQIVMTPRMVGG